MKVKRLGIEWGAAHGEAQPTHLYSEDAEVLVFESDTGELVVEVPLSAELGVSTDHKGRQVFSITVRDKH